LISSTVCKKATFVETLKFNKLQRDTLWIDYGRDKLLKNYIEERIGTETRGG